MWASASLKLALWYRNEETHIHGSASIRRTKKILGRPDFPLGGHDIRDAIMDFIAHWSERTEIGAWLPL
jgi:hypothetical protein